MRSTKTFCLLITMMLALNLLSTAHAQTGYAGMPGAYLHMGVGARALGMGKAYTALASDPTAIYWNPAGLANQNPYQIYVMHSTLFLDTNFDYIGASAPTKRLGSFGFGLVALSSNGFDQRSILNEELGKFSMMDMAFLFNWSKQIFSGISVGANYKVVSERMLEFSGMGHGFDIGIKTKLFNRVDVGLSLMNIISPKVKLANTAQKYPTQFRLGFASKLLSERLVVSADVTKIFNWESTFVNVGCEYQIINNISVRAGLHRGRFTIGTGFSFNHYGFDYSNSSVSELGMNHRFAVKYAFSGFRVKANAFPEVFSPSGDQNISKIKLHVKSRADISGWILEILDDKGNVVRNYSESGNIPEQVIWDGRDSMGALVEDGKFSYRFKVLTVDGQNMLANGSLVSIDSNGPAGFLGSNEINK